MQQHHALEAYSFSGRTIRFLSRDRLACMMLPSHFGACAKDETGGRRSPCWFLFTSDVVGSFFSVENFRRGISLVISWKTRKKIGNRFSSVEKSVIPVYQ